MSLDDLLRWGRAQPRQRQQVDLFAKLMEQDDELVAQGFPPMTPWWKATLRRFYASGKRRFVGRVGRKGIKSSMLCRVAVCEVLHGPHVLRPGDLGLFMFLSENTKEAKTRMFLLRSILTALRIEFDPIEGDIRLRGLPLVFGVRAARIGAVSGPVVIGFVADEVAKWRDDSTGANPATEVLASLRPATVTQRHAHQFLISSPWSTLDAHHDAFAEGDTDEQMVAHAESWVANPTITEAFTHTLERDEQIWRREFAAIPMGSMEASFFDHRVIDAAVVPGLVLPLAPRPGVHITGAGDLAFVRDSAALVFVHRTGEWIDDTSKYTVAGIHEMRPTAEAPLMPGEVMEQFAALLKQNGVDWFMADGHYRMTAVEHLRKHGLYFADAPEGQEGKAETYVRTRVVLHGNRLALPDDQRLIRQLKEITSRPTPGGGLSISSPRRGGGHGDLVSGLVLAIWQRTGKYQAPEDPIKPGTPEWAARLQTKEKDAAIRKAGTRDRKKWKQLGQRYR